MPTTSTITSRVRNGVLRIGVRLPSPSDGQRVRPFLIGTAVGGVTGAVVGTLLSQSTRRLLVGLIHLVTRRLTDDERDELRFELLLQ